MSTLKNKVHFDRLKSESAQGSETRPPLVAGPPPPRAIVVEIIDKRRP